MRTAKYIPRDKYIVMDFWSYSNMQIVW